jgi:hypothetical protein
LIFQIESSKTTITTEFVKAIYALSKEIGIDVVESILHPEAHLLLGIIKLLIDKEEFLLA